MQIALKTETATSTLDAISTGGLWEVCAAIVSKLKAIKFIPFVRPPAAPKGCQQQDVFGSDIKEIGIDRIVLQDFPIKALYE